MAEAVPDPLQVNALVTGRERFTNHAEWVSVTTGRWWHLPSSLRFFVAFAASCLRLMQPEWAQHPGIWRNTVLSRRCWPAGSLCRRDRHPAVPGPPSLAAPSSRRARNVASDASPRPSTHVSVVVTDPVRADLLSPDPGQVPPSPGPQVVIPPGGDRLPAGVPKQLPARRRMPLAAVLDEPAHQGGGDRLTAHRLALLPQQDQALIRIQIIRAQRRRATAPAVSS